MRRVEEHFYRPLRQKHAIILQCRCSLKSNSEGKLIVNRARTIKVNAHVDNRKLFPMAQAVGGNSRIFKPKGNVWGASDGAQQ
eukprot:2601002-Pleurochrysis_carterae.AAC.2